MCCIGLLGTKASSVQVTAALGTASCEASPLVQVAPAMVIPIICHNGLKVFFPFQSSPRHGAG